MIQLPFRIDYAYPGADVAAKILHHNSLGRHNHRTGGYRGNTPGCACVIRIQVFRAGANTDEFE